MIKNYIIIALRQLKKQKMYAAVKIGGFALSIAACFLISLYIRNEMGHDQTNPAYPQIFRVVGTIIKDGAELKGVSFPAPLGKVLKSDFPEIAESGRLMPNSLFDGAGSNQVRRADQQEINYEEGFTYIDQQLLNILDWPMVYGDKKQALTEPNTIIITASKAEKYFPNENPIGKILYLNDNKEKPYTIKGVIEDLPQTSHLHYDFFLTLSGVEFYNGEQNNWLASNYTTYIKLRPDTDIKKLEAKLTRAIIHNYMIPSLEQTGNRSLATQIIDRKPRIELQNLADIHLKSYNILEKVSRGDMRFILLFGGIAAFILIIACINFINLATAKSANRAKEVGLRKVIGSYRSSLIRQFLTESMLYSFCSILLGVMIAAAVLPYFNELSGKTLEFPIGSWWLLPLLIISSIFIGLVAGIYPAFYLSSFKPIQVLKGNLSQGSRNSVLRNGLVVFQFSTSIILIVGTFIIYQQMQYMLNKKLGYDKDQVMLIQGSNALGNQIKTFKNELLKLPQVKSVSVGDYVPVAVAGSKRNGNSFWNEGKQNTEGSAPGQFWEIDTDYIKTLGLHLVSGRNFSPTLPTDSQAAIINQTLARKLNLKDPVGKKITNGGNTYLVIGVVEDFNFESLKGNIDGLCMVLGSSNSLIAVKMNTPDTRKFVDAITATWNSFSPNQPVRFTFLDESYATMYADVQRMGSIFTGFALLAIIIACLGLFGLATYMAEQRTKEIGVRKVLGASISNITALLTLDFIRLVLLAMLIATPIAWLGMNKWLQDFAYRITINWWVFALAGILALLIAIATVSFQAIKAALTNPVKSLRSE
jgi:putative ABC transport system permease protein